MDLSHIANVVRCYFGVVLCCVNFVQTDTPTQINLIGLFPVTGPWDRGLAIKPAAEMALEDINNRRDILPGYHLNIFFNDTKCDEGLGIKAVADNVCHPPVKLMVLGEGCSTVSQAVAQVSHRWNLVQLSYVSVSPALSDRKRYPNFFRLVVSESVLNEARIELLRHFRWKRVATLHEDFQIFSTMVEDLMSRFKSEGIELVAQGVFSDDPETALARLMREDARIIIGGFYPNKARRVFCAAYHAGFYGHQVWITTTAISHNTWWETTDDVNCTSSQILTALRGTFIVHNVFSNTDHVSEGLTRMSVHTFRKRLDDMTRGLTRPVSGYNRAPNGYDSVWAAALALNKTMNQLNNDGSGRTLSDFTYTDRDMTELIKANLLKVQFDSVSGHVEFDSNGDGKRLVGVQIVKGDRFVEVGSFDNRKSKGQRLIMDDVYNGSVPLDGNHTEKMPFTLPIPSYITITAISSLGIVLSLLFLVFNCKNRHVKIIKMSSPKINNIILLGCILAYLSVFVEDIRATKQSFYCKLKISLILMAFSLSFGALFAKTWRIYTIFTASLQMKKRSVQDLTLFLLIGALVAVNSVVLVIWFIVDPQTVITGDTLDEGRTEGERIVQYVASYCWSEHQSYFLIVILVIQGVFLLLGVFLAWETRRVRFSTLNESHYIGMCIYNVVALGVVGVLVAYSIRNNPSLVYIIIATITILCTTVTQCLLFVPKILAFRQYSQGKLKDITLGSTADFQAIKTTTRASQTDLQEYRRQLNVRTLD